jgi:predicted amidohydrolase
VRCLLAAICREKGDVAGNLAAQLRILADAAAAGCDLAVFPELSLTGSVDPAANPERLISLDHPAVARLAAAFTPGDGIGDLRARRQHVRHSHLRRSRIRRAV